MAVSHDIVGTLRAQDHGHPPIVMIFESHGQDARYNLLGDICETVSAKYGTGGGYVPMLLVEPIVFRDDITIKVDGGGIAFSLDTMHREQAIMTYQRVTGTLNPGGHPGSYNGQDAYNDLLVTQDAIQDEIVHRGGRNGPDPGRKLL